MRNFFSTIWNFLTVVAVVVVCLFVCFFFQASRYRLWIQALSAFLDSANWPGTTYGLWAPDVVQHMFTRISDELLGRIMFQ